MRHQKLLQQYHRIIRLAAFIIAVILPLASPATAIENTNTLATVDVLQQRQTQINNNHSLDATERQTLQELYAQAISFTQQATTRQERLQALQATIKNGPRELNKLHQRIVNLQNPEDITQRIPNNANLDDVESLIFELESDASIASEARNRLNHSLESSLNGGRNLREQLATHTDLLNKIQSNLDIPKNNTVSVDIELARESALKARLAMRKLEISILKERIENDALLNNLANTERELAVNKINQLEPQLSYLSALAQRMRATQASERLSRAESTQNKFSNFPEPIRLFSNEYIALNQELEQLTNLEAQAIDNARSTQLARDNIQASFNTVTRRVEAVGPTSAIGRMLRKRLNALPSNRDYGRDASERLTEINRASDRQIDIDELRLDFTSKQAVTQTLLSSVDLNDVSSFQMTHWRKKTIELIEAHRNTLDKLFNTYGNYIAELTELDQAQQKQVAVSEEFTQFIRQTLLKIRSAQPIAFHDSLQATDTLAWALSPLNWLGSLHDFLEGARKESFFVANATILFLLFALFRRYSRRRLDELGLLTIKIRTDHFRHTIKALIYTFIVILSLPVMLATIGWTLSNYHNASNFSVALSRGFLLSAVVVFTTDFFRKACRIDGLVDRHFRWPNKVRALLRNEFHWFFPTSVILSFVVAATAGVAQNEHVPVLGRPAFVGLMTALLLLTYRVYRSNSPLNQFMVDRRTDHWVTNARIFWWPILLAIPLALMVASLLGYHYTAVHLSWRLLVTYWFLIITGIMLEILLRWVYVESRRIRFEEALRKREELDAREQTALSGGEVSIADEQDIDYNQLSEQAHRLLKTVFLLGTIIGIWTIWSDLLPALSFLDRIHTPFSAIEIIDGIEKQIPITLADIGVGLGIGFLTLFAAKNLPGILEFTILQRLPLEHGSRYTIVTISQYLIVAFGIFTVFSKIGVDWASIGWIVAALGVGLGFGLQEIFANFVSGLIILFEQPARVGDVVTVGNLTGSVSRIQIRATTIKDWDRKEIIVPNKNFITERVINWTLTDAITRVVIPINIGYDSDTKKAYQLIKSTAEQNPLVMEEPPLQLFFLGFGDSALNFELRVFVRQLDDRLIVSHQLHMAILQVLKANDIEIPFPQTDLHIRSTIDTDSPGAADEPPQSL